jgi:hypothetical protein
MKNLYKKRFPKRTKHEAVVDVLRMSDAQFAQFQAAARQLAGGPLFHKKLRAPRKKILPSSYKHLHEVDSTSTLATLIGMQQHAHTDSSKEYHSGGGLQEGASSVMSALWNLIGLGPEFESWFGHYDYEAPENKITKEQSDYAKLIQQSYKPQEERQDTIGDWTRVESLDTDKFTTWVNDENTHVALRGTQLNASDVMSDISILLSNQSSSADEVFEYLKEVREKYPEAHLSASAHSLGATQLMEAAGQELDVNDYYLFNPGHNAMLDVGTAESNEKLHYFLNTGDLVSNGTITNLAEGSDITYSKPTHNPLTNHSISQWIEDV